MYTNPPFNLLLILADQKIHSGKSLGSSLNISRAAIWKQVQSLQNLGVNVQSFKGRGYKLLDNLDLLKPGYIASSLLVDCDIDCQFFVQIDSTNTMLMRQLQEQHALTRKCVIAEMQTEGKGRRGRCWQSPFAKNLYFSLLWSFDRGVSGIDGLSLVVGISVVEALKKVGLKDVMLKWPNDVLVNNKKLAGILLEVIGDTTSFCQVVIGVGLNVHMRPAPEITIDQPWTFVSELVNLKIDRSEMLVQIIKQMAFNLKLFETFGFSYFVDIWKDNDAYLGKEVTVMLSDHVVTGIAHGVTQSGELLVLTQSVLRTFNSGEVSLRICRDIGN